MFGQPTIIFWQSNLLNMGRALIEGIFLLLVCWSLRHVWQKKIVCSGEVDCVIKLCAMSHDIRLFLRCWWCACRWLRVHLPQHRPTIRLEAGGWLHLERDSPPGQPHLLLLVFLADQQIWLRHKTTQHHHFLDHFVHPPQFDLMP